MPPPMFKTTSRSVVPKGTSTSPVLATWPVRAKVFVPGEAGGAELAGTSPRLRLMMRTTCASVSTLLMIVGLPHKPALRREGRFGPRHAALAFNRGDHRGLLAADKRARAFHHLAIQRSARNRRHCRPGNPFSAHPRPRGACAHRQRIFGADINQRLIGADGAGGDHQALEHAVRIAFHHAAVHERAGVAFVGVADHVFLRAFLPARRLPFAAGREAAAAAPTQAGLGDFLQICSGVRRGMAFFAAA